VVAVAIVSWLVLLVFDERWAAATYTSLIAGVIVLSIVVLTGYAGQLSLAQWTFAGVGALIAGQLVRAAHLPMELAIILGILLTIPVGLLFALPALRTRGVNLAVVTLGLGFTVYEVVFANSQYIGDHLDGGTKIGPATLFGIDVNGATNPHRWAVVCLVALVLVGLMVANLRRSRTGRRLLAVRTNERAAASLGISVFGVKLYAFAVAAGIAAVAGVLAGFQDSTITYGRFNAFASINAVGQAVIGGLGWVVGAVAAAPNAVGGLGSRVLDEVVHLGEWDELVGGVLLLVILVVHQDGIAPLVVDHIQPRLAKLRLQRAPDPVTPLPRADVEPVAPLPLSVVDLTVRFGGVVAVDGVSFEVGPGEVVGLIGPNGAGKTTVIDAVTGFVRPSAGTVSLGDERIERWGATRRARSGLRRSFQSLELFEDITVEQNIQAGADEGGRWSWFTDLVWPGHHTLGGTAVAAIESFELEPHLAQLPGELPYGRRRLVGIARAVASGPSLILLDEPAAGLDEHESRELGGLIRRIADERGMGVLLVEHDVGMVLSTCDRVVVIEFGRVIASGTPAEVRVDPAVRRAYLGHDEDEQGRMPQEVTSP
jgi:sulfate-transporting ATPase